MGKDDEPGSKDHKDFVALEATSEEGPNSPALKGDMVATAEQRRGVELKKVEGDIAAMEDLEGDLIAAEIEDKLRQNLELVRDQVTAMRSHVQEMKEKMRVPGFGGRRKNKLVAFVRGEAQKLQNQLQGVEGYDNSALAAFDVKKRSRSGSSRGWSDDTSPKTAREKMFQADFKIRDDVLYHLTNIDGSRYSNEEDAYGDIESRLEHIAHLANQIV